MIPKDIIMASFDTSTKHSGWAIHKNAIYNKSGTIDHEDIKDGNERLNQMLVSIFDLLNKEHPYIVVIEETKAPRNAKTQRDLTEILGAVRGWCMCNDAEFVAIAPSTWRKLVYGVDPKNRDMAKQWAIKKVKEDYGHECSDDEAEAILIGQARVLQFKSFMNDDDN